MGPPIPMGTQLLCGATLCSASGVAACCLPGDACGAVSAADGTCVSPAAIDPDCRDSSTGCCTGDGYCGVLGSDGCQMQLGAVIRNCDGVIVPFACGGVACAAHEQLGVGACCTEDDACGLEIGDSCVAADVLDADCPGSSGCCTERGVCGAIDFADGSCNDDTLFFGGTRTGCDGETVLVCEDELCDATGCCTQEGSCGHGFAQPANGATICVDASDLDVDEDCPGDCCSAEGYCGYLDADFVCRVTPRIADPTDCDGTPKPFACGGVVCASAIPGSSLDQGVCCTDADECGLVLGRACVATTELDAACPIVSGSFGCCLESGTCGVFDASGGTCLEVQGQSIACGGA